MRLAATLCTALGFAVLSALPTAAHGQGTFATYRGCDWSDHGQIAGAPAACGLGTIYYLVEPSTHNVQLFGQYTITTTVDAYNYEYAGLTPWPATPTVDVLGACWNFGCRHWSDFFSTYGPPGYFATELSVPLYYLDANYDPSMEALGQGVPGMLRMTATPEPATFSLVAGGLLLVGGAVRRRRGRT